MTDERTVQQVGLRDWLDANGVTVSELARRTGLTRQTIYNLMSGGKGPSIDTALLIQGATKGAIDVASWGTADK